MLIPVFTVLAMELDGATPTLMGVALGIYGLSQGILQMPFGMLSDRYGRKAIITIGLLLFIAGSLLGALTHSIYGMILARTLQGSGAIGSVLIALLADLTPDDQRTRAMAVIGVTIGMSFSLSMVLSPAITHHFGLSGIFYLTSFLALLGLLMLHCCVATPTKEIFHADTEAVPSLLKQILRDSNLQKLNAGIFLQHLILTSTFFAIPLLLHKQLQMGHLLQQWHFYLPLMIISFICMIPLIIHAEKKQQMHRIFIGSVAALGLAQLLLSIAAQTLLSLGLLMFIYFTAFNFLEASLPAMISRQANITRRGTAMGVYSTCQFLGIFVGGSMAGILFQSGGIKAIFLTNTVLCAAWIRLAWTMPVGLAKSSLNKV